MAVHDPIPLLQTAIGPVILISAVGLLLLTMNNRLAHVTDRARGLAKEAASASTPDRARLHAQVAVLWRRTRLLKHAIELVSMSALCAVLLIIALFVTALLEVEGAAWVIAALFIASLAALSGALLFLILDVNKSLIALQLELEGNERAEP